MAKKVFRISDMHCSACVMRLEGIEDEVTGIQRVSASYRKQQMEVEYDETQVTEQQIMATVQKHGYQAIPV
jgi:copper chaperone CopZ